LQSFFLRLRSASPHLAFCFFFDSKVFMVFLSVSLKMS
jgi:hypothetical protein